MMLKPKSITDIPTQTDSSYRQSGTLSTSIIEQMKTVESFDKHSTLLLLSFFLLPYTRIGINLTEENKKQEPYRQRSTMSLINIKINTKKSGLFLKKSNFTKRMTPKNPGDDTQKSGINPEKVPKIMAHPHWSRHIQVNSLGHLRKCILRN